MDLDYVELRKRADDAVVNGTAMTAVDPHEIRGLLNEVMFMRANLIRAQLDREDLELELGDCKEYIKDLEREIRYLELRTYGG